MGKGGGVRRGGSKVGKGKGPEGSGGGGGR